MVSLWPLLSDQEASREVLDDVDDVDGSCSIKDMPMSWKHFGDDDMCRDIADGR